MTRLQYTAIFAAAGIVFLLYFGFDTRSKEEKRAIAQLEMSGISFDVVPLIEKAKESLQTFDLNEINVLENRVQIGEGLEKIAALKELSGKWYKLDNPHIAGFYGEQVAKEENTAEAWSIAATTYLAGLDEEDQNIGNWCLNRSIEAFENAISIDPESVQYRVNLALLYAERPPQDNPMKGVQMLLRLNENNPEDVLVLNALARLAIKTGQWDRAKARLEKSESIESENSTTICLLAEVYQQLNDKRASAVKDKCELLTLKR